PRKQCDKQNKNVLFHTICVFNNKSVNFKYPYSAFPYKITTRTRTVSIPCTEIATKELLLV
ncbi:MAG: hypothetical protein J6X70_07835, partial [Muribaculaceae bacterium]|nr:hypothetical protein [Muribaculaceae bacterium]